MSTIVQVTIDNRHAWIRSDADTTKRLRDFWCFYRKGYRFSPKYKLRQTCKAIAKADGLEVDEDTLPGWDGKIHLFSRGKLSAGLFRATRQEAEQQLDIEFNMLYRLPSVEHAEFHPEIEGKWRHQDECVSAMLKSIRRGGGIALAATRTGKTRASAIFFKQLPHWCLFVVDQIDLLHQNAEEIRQALGEEVGVVGDKHYSVSRVTVATIQTLHKHIGDLKFLDWYKQVQIVIVDEIHEQLNRRNFDVLKEIRPIARYGITATLQLGHKETRMQAWDFAGPVIFNFPVTEGIKREVLTEGSCIQLLFPEIPTERGRERKYRDDYIVQISGNPTKAMAVQALVSSLIMAGRYVMVLVERVAHVGEMSDALKDIKHHLLYGDVDSEDRPEFRRRFESGDVRLLIANKIMKKGITLKRLDVVIDMAEMKSANDVMQKFGRGLGLHKDKDELLYIDVGTQTGRFSKAGRFRRRALISAGIEVKTVKVATPMEALKALKKFIGKRQPEQQELFG